MKKINILKIIVFAICLLAIVGLFLPYEKSIGEYREKLEDNPKETYLEEVDFKNEDVINVSLMENFKVYLYGAKDSDSDEFIKDESIINIVIFVALVVSVGLIFVFTLLNKSILTIIFSIIMEICALLMNYDIVSRGVMPSSNYTYGVTYYAYVILPVIVLICSIINIIKNKRDKKNKEKV